MDEIASDYGHTKDPHRRWLRHTYQEGPGFLFLATRGGRPPSRGRGHGDLTEIRRRARLLRVAREDGIAAALALGECSRASLFRWQAAYERGGLEGLRPLRRGPQQPVARCPGWIEQVVITVRLLTYWNSKRISAELRRRQIADVGETWIEALFNRLGTARPSLPREAGPRYERSQPNELWHIDIKGPFFIQLLERRYLKTWLVGLVDDHSRYVLGLRIQTSAQLAPILTWLRDCIELCGQPLAVMSDNGTPFVTWMPGVMTAFGKTLQEMAIRHIRTQINSPWTNGKIERFWKLLQAEVLDREVFRSLEEAEVALNRFAAYYNYHRLSGAIGWLTPAERFDGTPFTDRGFENIPALEHMQDWLAELMRAA
jgi:transposase InsO family protein